MYRTSLHKCLTEVQQVELAPWANPAGWTGGGTVPRAGTVGGLKAEAAGGGFGAWASCGAAPAANARTPQGMGVGNSGPPVNLVPGTGAPLTHPCATGA